jgi:hypothetical protein
MMLKHHSRSELVAAWVFAVVAIYAISVIEGAASSIGVGVLWAVACVVPPALVMLGQHCMAARHGR